MRDGGTNLNLRFLALQSFEIRSTLALHCSIAASSSSVTSNPGCSSGSTKQIILVGPSSVDLGSSPSGLLSSAETSKLGTSTLLLLSSKLALPPGDLALALALGLELGLPGLGLGLDLLLVRTLWCGLTSNVEAVGVIGGDFESIVQVVVGVGSSGVWWVHS